MRSDYRVLRQAVGRLRRQYNQRRHATNYDTIGMPSTYFEVFSVAAVHGALPHGTARNIYQRAETAKQAAVLADELALRNPGTVFHVWTPDHQHAYEVSADPANSGELLRNGHLRMLPTKPKHLRSPLKGRTAVTKKRLANRTAQKRTQADYGWVTQEMFDARLEELLDEETAVVQIPGAYEVLSEELGDEAYALGGDFDTALDSIVSSMSGGELLSVPGMYEVVAEELNNEVLRSLEGDRETALDEDDFESTLAVVQASTTPRGGKNTMTRKNTRPSRARRRRLTRRIETARTNTIRKQRRLTKDAQTSATDTLGQKERQLRRRLASLRNELRRTQQELREAAADNKPRLGRLTADTPRRSPRRPAARPAPRPAPRPAARVAPRPTQTTQQKEARVREIRARLQQEREREERLARVRQRRTRRRLAELRRAAEAAKAAPKKRLPRKEVKADAKPPRRIRRKSDGKVYVRVD